VRGTALSPGSLRLGYKAVPAEQGQLSWQLKFLTVCDLAVDKACESAIWPMKLNHGALSRQISVMAMPQSYLDAAGSQRDNVMNM